MKINHLNVNYNTKDWGGIEQTLLEYTNFLQAQGHTSKIYCCIIDKNLPNHWNIDVSLMPFLPPYFQNNNADIFHWHSGYTHTRLLLKTIPYLLKTKKPLIISIHDPTHPPVLDIYFNGKSSRYWKKNRLKKISLTEAIKQTVRFFLFKRLLPQVKLFICHSHEHLNIMKECFPDHRVEYLAHGVDIERFSKGDGAVFRKKYGIPENAFMVLTVARLDPVKKHHLLIELLPEMLKIHPNVHLVFIGTVYFPEFKAKLEKMILELKVEKFVTIIPGILPKDQDLVNAYHACDLFMLPRPDEVFGIVFVEAFCAGKCVIGSRSGGVPGVVTEGVTGLLHEPNNKLDILSCFKSVVLDADYRNKLGCAAREEVYKKFNWDAVGNKLINLYQSALQKNK